MKIIIFLVLAGLSLADVPITTIACPEPPPTAPPKTPEECLIKAFEAYSNFSTALRTFMCYYNGTFNQNLENHDRASRDYLTAMACVGCAADQWTGTNKTFEDLVKDLAKASSILLVLSDKTIDALGLNEPLLKLGCDLAGDALGSQCFGYILKKNTPEILYAVNELLCKGNISALNTSQMIDLLDNLRCFGEDSLHTNVPLNLFLKGMGDELQPALAEALNTLKDNLVKTDHITLPECGEPVVSAGDIAGGVGEVDSDDNLGKTLDAVGEALGD